MTKNITLMWELPTVRSDGDELDLEDVKHTLVEASADGGANFAALATVMPTNIQTVTVPDAEVGEWRFRFTVVDKLNQNGVQHVEIVTVADATLPTPAPPGAVFNVQVTLD